MNKMNFVTNLKHTGLLAVAFSLTGIPAWGYSLQIVPPPSIPLNGTYSTTGTFQITAATGYRTDGTVINLGSSAIKNANLNGPTPPPPFTLYPDIPDDVEVLRLVGNYTSTNPVFIPPIANFDIIVGGILPSGPSDFTYFLPATTSQPLSYQVTDLEGDGLEDNTNTFLPSTAWTSPTISLTPPPPSQLIDTFTQTGQTWYVASTPIGTPPPPPISRGCSPTGGPLAMNPHGGSVTFQVCPVPEPNSSFGVFTIGMLGASYVLKRKLSNAMKLNR